MWVYNSDYNKWFTKDDSISKSDFDLLKQELKLTRLYSRCLSGATYLPVNDLDNIYDILGDYIQRDWYVSADSTNGSAYSVTSIPPQHVSPIDKNTSFDYYAKYLSEYGLTLKNLFTPYRLIKDSSKNFYQVDVATTETIDLNNITENFTIDGIKLLDGHRVLVKNQVSTVILLATADPNTYFTGNYTISQDLGATIEYQYLNEENGIYRFINNSLVRETDLDDYNQCIRYSVLVKLGSNSGKQFHLSRLLDGYYPMTTLNQPIEFKEKHNWILRNRVDYNNLFEINYYDIIKHATQSYVYEGTTYVIPERTISIGEFGVILNTQEGKSNVIKNKYKVNLRSISQTSKYYWICGDESTLLKVRKHDFFIERVVVEDIPTTLSKLVSSHLNSVSFFDDLNGAVVGELNTILYTNNGGYIWNRIEISDFSGYNYNKVLYSTNYSFFVAGNTGVLIEFINSISGWTAYKRRVSKIEDNVDEYLLVENINDLYKTTLSSWSISYNYYTQSISTNKELLFLVTNNNLIAYDINNSFSQIGTDFIYFDFGQNYGDIRNITQKGNTNTFYFTATNPISGTDGIFSFNISNFSTIGTGSSYSNTTVGSNAVFEYTSYPNEIFDYNGEQLLICGNNSLLGISTYSTLNFNVLDPSFNDKLKSKMLFIDYDIASKLNFFTDQGDYRLPNSITFSTSLTASGSKLEFLPIEHGITSTNNGTYSETNWITYMTDSLKTFEYYSNAPLDETTKVLISTTFSYTNTTLSITYSNSNITASASLISYLAPMVTYATASRYNGQFLPAITAPSTTYNIFLYDYLMVYKVPLTYDVSKGDVLLFQSPVIDTKLIVNKIFDISGFRYLYAYTEFNQNIITDLTKTTGVITITNLNKYSNIAELKSRFNSHFISDGYRLDFVDIYGNITSSTTSVFQIKPKFNYQTAYYNLQYKGVVNSLQSSINYNNTYYFTGGSVTTSATVSATMLTLPNEGDTCTIGLYYNILSHTFTFKNSPVGTYQVQIGASINSTLSNLRTKILSSQVNSFLSGSSVNANQIGLTAGSTHSTGPNNTWYVNFILNSTPVLSSVNYDSVYTDSFLKFGYSPTYNLLDYLTGINNVNDINPKFYATKEYLAMPIYNGIPLGSLSSTTAYIDYNGMTYSGGSFSLPVNKIILGSELKLEWDSIFLNTFVDIEVTGAFNYKTEKLLVTDKYYDASNNSYVIEFHKRILPKSSLYQNILSGCTLNIVSRRYLYQISEDLQELNNIQRSKGRSNSWKDEDVYSYETYQNELNYKIPTDSYAKILLSDSDTIQQLSAIVYVDYKNELAMNITRLAKEYNVPIINTINYSGKLYIACSQKHDLMTGDGVVLDFIGGTGSSQQLNPQYSGYHVITKINDTDFVTEIDYGLIPTVGLDIGFVRYTKQDPFLNYEPVDLIDLGSDKKGKISIELTVDNLKLSNSVYSLINVDFEKYRFRLIDGLNIETVNLQYSWLLEAELSDALIGKIGNDLVWYSGTWIFGRWFGGIWQSGVWMSGDWYEGTWNSNKVTDKKISADVDTKTVDFNQSIWYTGRWYDGTWNGGVWNNGRWYGGTWNNGMWHKGTWNDGTWNNGSFEGGIWVLGTWNNGIFNCKNEPAYWLDGKWYGGDFENGMWYNGYWEQKNTKSRFGTKSFNSRTANWQAGVWVSGSFYSFINTDDKGLLDVSDVHKYSIWKTGQWLSGEWYGGIAYNMDFKTGTWYGGILEEIQVVGIDIVNNTFILNGIFKFNIGDTVYIIDNEIGNANSVYGSNLAPGKYKVLYQTEDSVNSRTILYVDSNLNGPSVAPAVETGLRVVSRFNNLNWKSGIWTNGIYDTGLWEGGIWYNGVFSGTWT
jgi:hypothetical protein